MKRCERVCGTKTLTVDSKDGVMGVSLARVLIYEQHVHISRHKPYAGMIGGHIETHERLQRSGPSGNV